jgi:imidazoleglycerol phosphate dehydratase HisB
MCTYATVKTEIDGSAKGPGSKWFHVTDGVVYFDHPVHALAEHTLNIDFSCPADGPAARVAVELTADSARLLIAAIQQALDSAPAALTS